MYKRAGQTVDQLLLHCQLASTLWQAAFVFYGLVWVMLRQVVEMLARWKGQLTMNTARSIDYEHS